MSVTAGAWLWVRSWAGTACGCAAGGAEASGAVMGGPFINEPITYQLIGIWFHAGTPPLPGHFVIMKNCYRCSHLGIYSFGSPGPAARMAGAIRPGGSA